MNRIVGSVVHRESKLGIPRLLITAFDVKPNGLCANTKHTTLTDEEASPGARLGSIVTDDHGGFEYECEAKARDSRPDLLLTVSAPQGRGTRGSHRKPMATIVRRDAASVESFVIELDSAQLEGAGVDPPGKEPDVDELIGKQRIAAVRQARLQAESQRVLAEALKKRRERERAADAKFELFLAALSTVPPERHNNGRYVAQGAGVREANEAMIKAGIKGRINKATAVGVAALSDEQVAQFKDANGNFVTAISSAAIDKYLHPPGQGPSLVRQVPPRFICHRGPVDPCVAILEGKDLAQDTHDEHPSPEQDDPGLVPDGSEPTGDTVTAADIPLLIDNLVKHMTPPESATIFSKQGRATIDDLQKTVAGFELHSGPADAPALHEFHHLQIAFDHVWQELFDDDVVQTGKELYADLVEMGVDPNEYLIDPSEIKISVGKKPAKKKPGKSASEPPASVVQSFEITPEQWTALKSEHRNELEALATKLNEYLGNLTALTDNGKLDYFKSGNNEWLAWKREQIHIVRRKAQLIISYADEKARSTDTFDQLHPLLNDLAAAMKEPYRFSIYAANRFDRSINFGIVATYRQKWTPQSYQVGELIKTVPLAPKEVRRFSKKVTMRQSRAEKEVENNLQARKTENTETARAETQIVQKALNKTNFQLSAQGGVNIGIANAKGSTAFSQGAAAESQEVKKEFRQAVFKATEEYKSERTTEINVSTSEEASFEESGEVSNPNDEITVTYMFYELQRRYRISEQIHRVTPVVLVAQEFPKPSDIDEAWIVAHDWILRRVILDDSFVPAMNYVASKVVGDEVALQETLKNLHLQRRVVGDLKEELVAIRAQVGSRYAAFQKSIEKRAEAIAAQEDSGEITPMPVGFLISDSDASPEAQQVRENAARDAYEREAKLEKELLARLDREATALTALTETYTKTLSEHLNRKEQIARLRVHIKSNIMYYMQAIWSHESDDQRYFRLHEVRVPKLKGKLIHTLASDPDAIPLPPTWTKPLKHVVKCEIDADDIEFESLEQVADLDNLLGFKGNYMMFPLKQGNVLTDFMMMPYLDPVAGLRDPDPLGDWTLTDFVDYVCCLRHSLSQSEFDKLRPGLEAVYRHLVNAPGSDGEEIIVPTDSLFIEALPGVHPILEDFKLFHRVVDVKKVQAEVRGAEFENLRAAARLLAGEREDPTIEKKIVVEGGTDVLVAPDA